MGKRRKNKKGCVPKTSLKGGFDLHGDCPDCEKHFKVRDFDFKSDVFCPFCGASVKDLYSDLECFGKP